MTAGESATSSPIPRFRQAAAQLPPSLGCARIRELWDAWRRLAELTVGYDDLTDEAAAGHPRNPAVK